MNDRPSIDTMEPEKERNTRLELDLLLQKTIGSYYYHQRVSPLWFTFAAAKDQRDNSNSIRVAQIASS
jgi:hypothetical protein